MSESETGMILDKDRVNSTRKQNLFKLQTAYESHEVVTNAMPTHIWIEPTNLCNAKCPLCPTGARESQRPKAIMELATFQRIVDEIYPFTQSMNLWNIGEPFLNPSIFKMINYASNHNMSTRISTNGFVFYDLKKIDLLISSGLKDLVVSLDGTTAPVFNQYRVGVNFDRVLQGLKSLQLAKKDLGTDRPTVVWQFLAMNHNIHQITKAKALAEELGVVFSLKSINLDMVHPDTQNADFLPQEDNLRRYRLDQNNHWTLKSERQENCANLWRSLMVNADGTVIPCCYDFDVELVLGHFPELSIAEIWEGEQMQRLRKKILTERQQLPPCSKCSVDDRTIIFLDEIPIRK